LWNYCCSGEAIIITYSECLFVALGIQHAIRIRHIVMSPTHLYSIFSPYLINGTNSEKKILNLKYMFLFSLQLLLETFLILRRHGRDIIKICIGLYVQYLLSCQLLMMFEFSRQSFEQYSNFRFYSNPSSGSRVVHCGWTDMTELIVAFAVLRTHLKTNN
jgi:hypothetical protein